MKSYIEKACQLGDNLLEFQNKMIPMLKYQDGFSMGLLRGRRARRQFPLKERCDHGKCSPWLVAWNCVSSSPNCGKNHSLVANNISSNLPPSAYEVRLKSNRFGFIKWQERPYYLTIRVPWPPGSLYRKF